MSTRSKRTESVLAAVSKLPANLDNYIDTVRTQQKVLEKQKAEAIAEHRQQLLELEQAHKAELESFTSALDELRFLIQELEPARAKIAERPRIT